MPNHHTFDRKETLAQFNIKKGILIDTKPSMSKQECRAVIYCRVSSSKQVSDGNGLRSQEMACRDRCKKQYPPILVDRVFIEP